MSETPYFDAYMRGKRSRNYTYNRFFESMKMDDYLSRTLFSNPIRNIYYRTDESIPWIC